MDTITLRRPDDWHLHLRDGAMLAAVAPDSARDFGRAIIMPNLVPPVVTGAQAAAYRDRIRAAVPAADFAPLMTLYLTEATDPADVVAAHAAGIITAVKLYPAGATTNSASGVRDFDRVRGVLEAMAEAAIPLLVHGEVTDPDIDIFDREAVFIDRVLDPIRRATPGLRVVMEHITTSEAVGYVRADTSGALGATVTVHHLVINRNHILAGGIRPHYYCLPVAKRETHRVALVDAATSGDARFFLGTDSAPHVDAAKETGCGCAGCYTAPVALPILAQVFEDAGALDRLEGFTSLHGPAFYGLAPNEARITLTRAAEPWSPHRKRSTAGGPVTVFDPGFPLHWRTNAPA
ncbi:dihydroorotase [Rhodobaculum claviforme]|uniref:Dihydroorotase n=1 Tax=Rhodobaculum claviforme TaxID=1549854 RepID=A0A934TMA9_9RHOB|nr:dihydroorotase [Rhodobaculum claviforme]MBK5928492.1 dihydroorotase [Rhodobaculum claviforme]